ncbi:LacI family transcriptional regulator [Halomonas sp. EGI 63088]|uniref:LacI family transcriptional regulator n=1 Tax=Halomonas flagellata TaxID=2920385 RepID=A0ABS9RVW0_9GAMM|nr:LacI family DNA-binding transcriptional regulator [Halomonas flagellata]MCH4563982.1 LacI family transcriptional regulator [Halomonas flagellata]
MSRDDTQTERPGKGATIREIAKAAGVSIASVSRALNGKPGISEALREHILQISRDIHYQPSAAARALIGGKSAVVGISLGRQDIELRPYYILLYQHLTLALYRQGMVPIFFACDQTPTLPERAGSAILLSDFPGDERPGFLASRRIPFVRIGPPGEGFSVAPDDRYGIYLATRHLIEGGRRRIAFIGNELGDDRHRLLGYQQALTEAGLPESLISVPFSYDPALTAYRYLGRFLQPGPPLDGLVCENDEFARGCLTALEDRGIRVPEQVAVTGFDDLPTLAAQLTTVRQDIGRLAVEAVGLLGEAIAGARPRHIDLPVTLIRRQTG